MISEYEKLLTNAKLDNRFSEDVGYIEKTLEEGQSNLDYSDCDAELHLISDHKEGHIN